MPGHRRTHTYPNGIPIPLLGLSLVMVAVGVAWVLLVPGHWPRAIGILAAFAVLAYANTRLHRHYEQTGQAVRIPRPNLAVKYPKGLPAPLLVARTAFFITIGAMLVFGFAPIADSTAKHGIIGCVFALIAVAVLNIGLERLYAHVRRGTEVDISQPNQP